jgi:hypothetical protein
MRNVFVRITTAFIACAALVSHAAPAATVHPVESALRSGFPSLSLESAATFESTDVIARTASSSGLRARFPRVDRGVARAEASLRSGSSVDAILSVVYPRHYDGLLVAQFGTQRVVLRATGATGAPATESNGKLVYTRPYTSIDVVEVPRVAASEELLILRDSRAPRVFEYEIVETEGIAGVVLDSGAIRFLPAVASPAIENASPSGRFTQLSPALRIDRPWIVDAWGKRSETQAEWTLIGKGSIPTAIRLTVDVDRLPFPIIVDPSFSVVGSLGTPRDAHTATLLTNGKVLIVGGADGSSDIASAELYDPATATFSATGSLGGSRELHTATLLPNGKVLIVGGYRMDGTYLATAELYDPASGTFTATGGLATARAYHTATLLPNGKVLIAGGENATDHQLTSAELYDPSAGPIFAPGRFSATGSMGSPREYHTATLLATGKVLITGGRGTNAVLNTAELYDPSNGTFSGTGSMTALRGSHIATRMQDGTVLVAGGWAGSYLGTAERYTPGTGTFSAVTGTLATARSQATATLLPSGKVMITGGENLGAAPLASAELFDPVSATFSSAGLMVTNREYHTATLLPNAQVLIAGGFAGSYSEVGASELFEYASGTFTATGSLAQGRWYHTATLLPNGKALIAGGVANSTFPPAALYDGSATFTAIANLKNPRSSHTATLLATGKVLLAGGYQAGAGSAQLASAELFDPGTNTFSLTGSMAQDRTAHTSTLLPNGKVLIAAGMNYSGLVLDSAELYDPATATFIATGTLAIGRRGHTATLLANGKVLIVGGRANSGVNVVYRSAEIYDPANGTFAHTGSPLVGRDGHTATLLPDGKVLVAGGSDAAFADLASAELYDPSSGTFSGTGGLGTPRGHHTATLLPNGKVLVAAGSYQDSAELYDPITGTFSTTGSLGYHRMSHSAALLPSGKVLIAGGSDGAGASLASAELYDAGIGAGTPATITSAPSTLTLPATLTIGGSGFRTASEASSGGTNSSATNYPLVQLQRVDNEQTSFVVASSTLADTSWSGSVNYLPTGAYRLSIFTNGIPSTQKIIQIFRSTPTITGVSPNHGRASGGQSVTVSGTNLRDVSVTIGGNSATVTDSTDSTVTFVTPAHAVGIVDVTVTSAARASATSVGAYTYRADPPDNVTATAISATSVAVSWTATAGATTYEVLKSSDGTSYTHVSNVTGTSATDATVAANTSYLYVVRETAPTLSEDSAPDLATTVMFTNDPLFISSTVVQAVHITELRTAVTAVRQLAGVPGAAYTTDATITPGATVVKAAHLMELHTSLNEARVALSLPTPHLAGWGVSPGAQIRTTEITDLRDDVK